MQKLIFLLAFVQAFVARSQNNVSMAVPAADPNAPVMIFEKTEWDYGTMPYDTPFYKEFKFKNTGKSPLVISQVYTNTGAAVATWPKEPIAPGKTGIIKYHYDTKRVGPFSKQFQVQCNASNNPVIIKVKGVVEKQEVDPKVFPGEKALVIPSQSALPLKDDAMLPEITFEKLEWDYGTVPYDSDFTKTFTFKNTGKSPLIIQDAITTCGCDMGSWDKEPVMPGKTGVVKYKYDTKRVGPFNHQFPIRSNAKGGTVYLTIKGVVPAPPKDPDAFPSGK